MNFLVLSMFLCSPPDTLRLNDAVAEALSTYPLRRQMVDQKAIGDLRVRNLSVRYYPELVLTGQASYQSQVIELPIRVPSVSIPSPLKESYQLSLTASQLLYDFGQVGSQKDLERAQSAYDQQAVEIELYKVKSQVNDAFFSVLVMQEREKSLLITQADVSAKLALVTSRVQNGTSLASNQAILEAELLKIGQQLAETRANKRSALQTLEILLDRTLPEGAVLAIPLLPTHFAGLDGRKRPEYTSFDLLRRRLDHSIQFIDRRNLPRLSAFVQFSYARPGLNAFETSFQEYYVAGIRASWSIWNWNTDRRDEHIVRLQKDLIRAQEESFTKGLAITAQRYLSDMARLEELIRIDQEIVELRRRVTEQMSSQLDNGVITSSEYLTELNAEHQSRLTLELHRLQLVRAQTDYLTTVGE